MSNYYPINKQEAYAIISMSQSPGWDAYVKCVLYEAEQYKQLALGVGYSPDAIEKFRFNQGIAQNLTRIVGGVLEEANAVLNDEKPLSELDADDI